MRKVLWRLRAAASLTLAAFRFPICETSIPPPVPGDPMNWGTATSHEFRIRICIDHVDDIFFQYVGGIFGLTALTVSLT